MAIALKLRELPNLVVSDKNGEIFDLPEFGMTGKTGEQIIIPEKSSLIPLPEGSSLYLLPGRHPIGINRSNGKTETIREYRGQPVFAVAAFMSPAHTQMYYPAYRATANAPSLPLFAYTAVGWKNGRFFASGVRVDKSTRHDPTTFDDLQVQKGADRLKTQYPGNRVVVHLIENCIKRYGCPNAKNLALSRSEAPAPISPSCNARCKGCISFQDKGDISCAQQRICFVPTSDEIVSYAVPHLKKAKKSLLSFGQGCEGEPLLQSELIKECIRKIRNQTNLGTIHMNTNGSKPDALRDLFETGLDSVRISLNSCRKEFYLRHFNPTNYTFEDVIKSLGLAHKLGKWCSINYFVFPGFTDNPDETKALISVLKHSRIDFIQLRNLNMDPEIYLKVMSKKAFNGKEMGLLRWMQTVTTTCPWIRFGYYNPAKEEWQALRK